MGQIPGRSNSLTGAVGLSECIPVWTDVANRLRSEPLFLANHPPSSSARLPRKTGGEGSVGFQRASLCELVSGTDEAAP